LPLLKPGGWRQRSAQVKLRSAQVKLRIVQVKLRRRLRIRNPLRPVCGGGCGGGGEGGWVGGWVGCVGGVWVWVWVGDICGEPGIIFASISLLRFSKSKSNPISFITNILRSRDKEAPQPRHLCARNRKDSACSAQLSRLQTFLGRRGSRERGGSRRGRRRERRRPPSSAHHISQTDTDR
jgi:hypothetical protein